MKKRKKGSGVAKRFSLRGRRIEISDHARDRIESRKIAVDQVERTVESPQDQRPSEEHRFELWRVFFSSASEKRRLKVVVADNDPDVVAVVSAMWSE